MLLNAELLLQYQRCRRRTFSDGDLSQRDAPAGLLLKLQQDKFTHQQTVLTEHPSYQPDPKATGTQVQRLLWN